MRYAIPLGAILLIGIASSILRSPNSPAVPGRSPSVRNVAALETDGREERVKPRTAEPVSGALPERKGTSSASAPAIGAGPRKMLGTLDRAVGLNAVQQSTLEQLLRDRENEIRTFQQSIRATGVLDVRDYEWRVDLMKDSWYRRMDALLDGSQHVRFLALLEKGFFNEGLELTIEPGMTVLD